MSLNLNQLSNYTILLEQGLRKLQEKYQYLSANDTKEITNFKILKQRVCLILKFLKGETLSLNELWELNKLDIVVVSHDGVYGLNFQYIDSVLQFYIKCLQDGYLPEPISNTDDDDSDDDHEQFTIPTWGRSWIQYFSPISSCFPYIESSD